MIRAKVKQEYCISFEGLPDVKFNIGDTFTFEKVSDNMIKEGYMLITDNIFPDEIKEFTFSKETFDKIFAI